MSVTEFEYYKLTSTKATVEKFNKKECRVILKGCDTCKDCCGTVSGYQPFALLKDQNSDLFYKDDSGIPCIHSKKGCKSLSNKGCSLISSDRPVLCNIFPYRLMGKRLNVQMDCPAVLNTPFIKLHKVGLDVMKYLCTLPDEFLFRLIEIPVCYNMVDLNICFK